MKKKLIEYSMFLLLVIFLTDGCSNRKNQEQSEENQSSQNVKAAVVSVRADNESISGFGTLSYQKKTDLSASVDSVLETLYIREGDYIKKGAAALKLKNLQINLAVKKAENNYTQAEAALELSRIRLAKGEIQAETRILENENAEKELELSRELLLEQQRKQAIDEQLYEAGGVSYETIHESRFGLKTAEEKMILMEKEFELRCIGLRKEDLIIAGITPPEDETELRKAIINLYTEDLRAEYKAAEAFLESSVKELESNRLLESELTIIAPLSGIVVSRYFEEGERLKKDDKILTIIDTESLYALFSVSESDSLKLMAGMDAVVSVDGTGGVYNGKLDLIYPQGDYKSFSFMIRVLLPSSENNILKPGMFARITIPLETMQNRIIIPETALAAKRDNQGKVFIIHEKTIKERSVVLGRAYGDEREILQGLEKGEIIVLQPDVSLKDGTYVSALY